MTSSVPPIYRTAPEGASDGRFRETENEIVTPMSEVAFPRERLEWIHDVEEGHFWHAPRRRLLRRTIRRHLPPGASVLDVGCGTGRLGRALSADGYEVFGVDPYAGAMGLDPLRFPVGEATSLPWPDGRFDAACAFDVLEHVDDRAALAEVARVMRPPGLLFVSVPACPFLWSDRDTIAGHRRRYRRATLRRVLCEGGFVVDHLFGYQLTLLPLLVASRAWGRLRGGRSALAGEDRPGSFVNGCLRAVNEIEVSVGRLVPPPSGSSLLAVAHRRFDGSRERGFS